MDGRHLKLTNAPWVLDGPTMSAMLRLENGLLLNDFEAQALSLPAILPAWVRIIGPDLSVDAGPQAILGPGTGLGIACLVQSEGRHVALASEACHVGFAPETAEEEALWPHLERAHGRITTESVLSGIGLVRLHRARLAERGSPASPGTTAADVVSTAIAAPDSEAAATVALYWTLVGRFAGDIAITFKATGGVNARRRDPAPHRRSRGPDRVQGGFRSQGSRRRPGAPHPDAADRPLRFRPGRHGGSRGRSVALHPGLCRPAVAHLKRVGQAAFDVCCWVRTP